MDERPTSKKMVIGLGALAVSFVGILTNNISRYQFIDALKNEAASASADYREALNNCARTIEVDRPWDGVPFSTLVSSRYNFNSQVRERKEEFIAEWATRN